MYLYWDFICLIIIIKLKPNSLMQDVFDSIRTQHLHSQYDHQTKTKKLHKYRKQFLRRLIWKTSQKSGKASQDGGETLAAIQFDQDYPRQAPVLNYFGFADFQE